MLLLDLQKAFGTIDHSMLHIKLEASGVGNDILFWFKSYLSDRTQLVDLSETHSSCSPITCGVGAFGGKAQFYDLLCLVYVNDMSDVFSVRQKQAIYKKKNLYKKI